MDTKELRALMEAYQQVYAPIDEAITSEKGKAKAAAMIAARSTPSGRAKAGKGENVAQIKHIVRSEREGLRGTPMTPTMAKNPAKSRTFSGTGNKAARRAGTYEEGYDIFDAVLEFLQVEGYAETLEEAEWLMANVIDEEAIDIILGEGHGSRTSFKKQSADERKRIGMFKGSKIEYTPHKNYDPEANRGQGQILRPNQAEKQRRKKLAKSAMGEEFVDEAQAARENPDKYEREQEKKYAPVRGERTPMPPRGNKRREDFEKWYAKNVR